MNPLRAYIDTSVLGGYYDRLFEEDTRALIRSIHDGAVIPVVSDMVLGETARAPERVRLLLHDIIAGGAEILAVTEEAVELQEAYLRNGILGRRWQDDAMHVAIATLARVDVIVSWNFKYLVDPRKARGFNGVNLSVGYGLITILSPSDIVRYLEE